MRETILASNLIRKLNFMRSATLAICLGLLPSQVFAATQTCETYPDCATMGYTQTSCDDYSISLKCPFDDSKLFCSECDRTYNIKDPVNNLCVDGKTYCANQNGGEEFDRGECVSCDGGYLFNKSTYKCEDGITYCAKTSQIYDSSKNECVSCGSNQAFDATNKKCTENVVFNYNISSSLSNVVSRLFTFSVTGPTVIGEDPKYTNSLSITVKTPTGVVHQGSVTSSVSIPESGMYTITKMVMSQMTSGNQLVNTNPTYALKVNGTVCNTTCTVYLRSHNFITIDYTEGAVSN